MLLTGKNIDLRTATPDDARFILALRLDEELTRHISRVENSLQKQYDWLREYKERERLGKEYYFVIQSKVRSNYGTVRLYDFRGTSFCWGSWILNKDVPSSSAIESALLLYEFAFYHRGFERSHFDVRKENIKVVAFHTRFGARIVNEDELNYYFDFSKADYEKTRLKYMRFLPASGIGILADEEKT
jgi:RimJ/RimL family protein N-acetyltransferase